METAEKSYDSAQSHVNFLVTQTLNALLELSISVVGDTGGCGWILIHKVLEGCVSSLLELNVVVE